MIKVSVDCDIVFDFKLREIAGYIKQPDTDTNLSDDDVILSRANCAPNNKFVYVGLVWGDLLMAQKRGPRLSLARLTLI